jgi:hypothetical protein
VNGCGLSGDRITDRHKNSRELVVCVERNDPEIVNENVARVVAV